MYKYILKRILIAIPVLIGDEGRRSGRFPEHGDLLDRWQQLYTAMTVVRMAPPASPPAAGTALTPHEVPA